MLEHDFEAARHEIFIFYIFSSPYNQLVIFDVIVFALAAFVLFRDLSRKNAWLNYTIPFPPNLLIWLRACGRLQAVVESYLKCSNFESRSSMA